MARALRRITQPPRVTGVAQPRRHAPPGNRRLTMAGLRSSRHHLRRALENLPYRLRCSSSLHTTRRRTAPQPWHHSAAHGLRWHCTGWRFNTIIQVLASSLGWLLGTPKAAVRCQVVPLAKGCQKLQARPPRPDTPNNFAQKLQARPHPLLLSEDIGRGAGPPAGEAEMRPPWLATHRHRAALFPAAQSGTQLPPPSPAAGTACRSGQPAVMTVMKACRQAGSARHGLSSWPRKPRGSRRTIASPRTTTRKACFSSASRRAPQG